MNIENLNRANEINDELQRLEKLNGSDVDTTISLYKRLPKCDNLSYVGGFEAKEFPKAFETINEVMRNFIFNKIDSLKKELKTL